MQIIVLGKFDTHDTAWSFKATADVNQFSLCSCWALLNLLQKFPFRRTISMYQGLTVNRHYPLVIIFAQFGSYFWVSFFSQWPSVTYLWKIIKFILSPSFYSFLITPNEMFSLGINFSWHRYLGQLKKWNFIKFLDVWATFETCKESEL